MICIRGLLTISRKIVNIHFRCNYNLYDLQTASFRNNSLKSLRYLSSSVTIDNKRKKYDALTYLDNNIRKDQRIYKDDVLSVIKDIEQKGVTNEENMLLILQCCGHLIPDESPEKRMALAHQVWQTFQDNNITLYVHHYNTMLHCYIENRVALSYKDFLEKMTCEPNEETYQLLLKCVCENGDVTQAVEIVNVMKNVGLPANEQVFSSLIFCHLRSGDIKSAQNILATMHLAKLTPSTTTYLELMRGYAEIGDTLQFKFALHTATANCTFNDLTSVVRSICNSGNVHLLSMVKNTWPGVISARMFQAKLPSVCVQMIYQDKSELAYETYKCLVDPEIGFQSESDTYASVILYEMARAKTKPEKIIKITEDLIKTELNHLALFKALEASLQVLNVELAITLMRNLHDNKISLRNHYFWPLLIHEAKHLGQNGVFDMFQVMKELTVPIQSDTLEMYSLKYLAKLDPDVVISRLKQLNLTVKEIITPLCVVLLRNSRVNEVIDICLRYKVALDVSSLIRPLGIAFLSSNDVKSTVNIMKYVDFHNKNSSNDWNGQIITYLLTRSTQKSEQILRLLQAFKKNNLKINSLTMDKIESISKRLSDQNISSKILQVSQSLVDQNQDDGIGGNLGNIPHPRNMNLEQLECHLIELKTKKMETRGILRKLIQMHCRHGNVDRVLELCVQFQKSDYKMSTGMKAGLLDVYIKSKNLESAYKIFTEILENDPSFTVDDFKVIDLATLLVAKENFDEAVKILKLEGTKRKIRGGKTIEHNCWSLLDTAANSGENSQTKILFNTLITCGYCVTSNVILGPLVRVHLNNDDLKQAVEEYINCCSKYKQTPLQHELLCKLVDTESPTELIQKVVGATELVHGIHSAKIAVTAALAETGKCKTLREFLMDQSAELPSFLLDQYCQRWVKEGNVTPLQTLVSCSKGLAAINLTVVYHSLMRIYYANNDWQSALTLWNDLQEKDYLPAEESKSLLTTLLINHNHPLASKI